MQFQAVFLSWKHQIQIPGQGIPYTTQIIPALTNSNRIVHVFARPHRNSLAKNSWRTPKPKIQASQLRTQRITLSNLLFTFPLYPTPTGVDKVDLPIEV